MRSTHACALAAFAVMALCQLLVDDCQAAAPSNADESTPAECVQQGLTLERMGSMPLAFTENQGQWDERVKFRANAGGATIWFTVDGVYYQFTRTISGTETPGAPQLAVGSLDSIVPPQALRRSGQAVGHPDILRGRLDHELDSIEQLVIKASFVDANLGVEVVGEGLMEYKCNYFIGNDPSKWYTDVPNYSSVLCKEIYPGIDLRYFGVGSGKAGYEFIAAPGVDMEQIKVEYEGVDELSVDASGRLVARTGWGDMIAAIGSPGGRQTSPQVLSHEGSVPSGLLLFSEKTAGFDVAVNVTRQPASSLLTLEYSTYLGGNDYDQCHGIAVDDSGAAYVTGITCSADFPTLNPYQTYQGPSEHPDVFVTKLSSFGNSLVYSTYLGGSDDDYGWGIAVDGSGAAYVTGCTYSTDFPTLNPYQTDQGDHDVFVTKLSSTGNNLVYSTYLGGSNQDRGLSIAVGGSGAAYVTGNTESADFPTLNPFQTYPGLVPAFVTKLSSSGNSLVYSTYLGGSNSDAGLGIAVDSSGAAYVTGQAGSTDFPTLNPYQGTFQGGHTDAFVTKLSGSGSSLVYSTYLGGSGFDQGCNIAVDRSGTAYVTGLTESTDFPTLNPYQGTYQGGWMDVFVTKLSSSGSSLVYSTYLGGSDNDQGWGIAVDGSGAAYVTGETESTDFPTLNPCLGTYQGGWSDAFVTKLTSSGNSLAYSTYLGGSSHDCGSGIAVDAFGAAYVTGVTQSSDFPAQDPYQTVQGWWDVFVTKIAGFYCVDSDDDGYGDPGTPENDCPDDNCPFVFNPLQDDTDSDNIGDSCDTCTDADDDGYGNPGFPANTCPDDNCPIIFNPDQGDIDEDGLGDACDDDTDGDDIPQDGDGSGVPGDNPCTGGETENCDDNCPNIVNPTQEDIDADGVGDPCDDDIDGDDIPQDGDGSGVPGDNPCTGGETEDCDDNCPDTENPMQGDTDADGVGDLCDNCLGMFNPLQADFDLDGIGDDCDTCTDFDSDGYGDPGYPANTCPSDNCPSIPNPDQIDSDEDGYGDACDICGDANTSGGIDIDDAVYLIAYIFSGGPPPDPYESGDADCSGDVDIDDVVWLIAYIFSGGPAPCDTDGDGVPNC